MMSCKCKDNMQNIKLLQTHSKKRSFTIHTTSSINFIKFTIGPPPPKKKKKKGVAALDASSKKKVTSIVRKVVTKLTTVYTLKAE